MGTARKTGLAALVAGIAVALTLGVTSVAGAEPPNNGTGDGAATPGYGYGYAYPGYAYPGYGYAAPQAQAQTPGQAQAQALRQTQQQAEKQARKKSSNSGSSGNIDLNRPVSDSQLLQVTDYLMFKSSMSDFQRVRKQRLLSTQLDWNTDACSRGVKAGYDFRPACERREFGYKNFDLQRRLNSGKKDQVDDKFRDELRAECDGKSLLDKTVCEKQADVYLQTVKNLG